MTVPSPAPDPDALRRAADAGDGAAAHRLAVLTAMGLGLPQDWGAALELLARAAALDFEPAAEELTLLRGADGRTDLHRWLTSPPPRPIVTDGPAILAIEQFLPAAVCDHLWRRAAARISPALVYDPTTGQGRRDPVRSNDAARFELPQMDVLLALVRERIARVAGLPVAGLEWTQVLRYAAGQSFDWHVDWLDPANPAYAEDLRRRGQRIATCLVYLNDDYEGGETAFEAGALRWRGRKGDALLWANTLPDGTVDRRTRHAGLPPTLGEKRVLSQWLRGRAPQP